MKWFAIILVAVWVLGSVYLLLPSSGFPEKIPDSLQSKELADTEDPNRRAYFTNYSREEVIEHYMNNFGGALRLNYPPEESQTLIRDQTRSTYLEEIVHPMRESIYINGFEPKEDKDKINIEGRHFRQKIIVKYVEGNKYARVVVFGLALVGVYLLVGEVLKREHK